MLVLPPVEQIFISVKEFFCENDFWIPNFADDVEQKRYESKDSNLEADEATEVKGLFCYINTSQ